MGRAGRSGGICGESTMLPIYTRCRELSAVHGARNAGERWGPLHMHPGDGDARKGGFATESTEGHGKGTEEAVEPASPEDGWERRLAWNAPTQRKGTRARGRKGGGGMCRRREKGRMSSHADGRPGTRLTVMMDGPPQKCAGARKSWNGGGEIDPPRGRLGTNYYFLRIASRKVGLAGSIASGSGDCRTSRAAGALHGDGAGAVGTINLERCTHHLKERVSVRIYRLSRVASSRGFAGKQLVVCGLVVGS